MSRRFRRGVSSGGSQPTDEHGQPIAFAIPGAPTLEERRRYAEAVQRATTPPPLTKDQQAARDAAVQRRRAVLQSVGVYVDE